MKPSNGFRVSDIRRLNCHQRHEPGPELRLPGEIGGQITDVPGKPVSEQLRTLAGVGGEQSGQSPRHRVTAALAQLPFFAGGEMAEMGGQRAAPGFIESGIDDLQQRPGHGLR